MRLRRSHLACRLSVGHSPNPCVRINATQSHGSLSTQKNTARIILRCYFSNRAKYACQTSKTCQIYKENHYELFLASQVTTRINRVALTNQTKLSARNTSHRSPPVFCRITVRTNNPSAESEYQYML